MSHPGRPPEDCKFDFYWCESRGGENGEGGWDTKWHVWICLVPSLPVKCASSLGCSTTQDDITSRVSRATDILPSLVTSDRRGSIPKLTNLTNIFSPETSLLIYETITFCETGHTLTTLPRSFSHPPMLIWRCENHEDAGPSDLPIMIKTVALIHPLLIEKKQLKHLKL